jgi:hypothetical protein
MQKDGDDNEKEIDEDVDEDEDDKGTQFPPEEQPVSPPSVFPLKFSSMTLNNYIRESPRSRLKFRQNKSLTLFRTAPQVRCRCHFECRPGVVK